MHFMRLISGKHWVLVLIMILFCGLACSANTTTDLQAGSASKGDLAEEDEKPLSPPQPIRFNSIEEAQAHVSFKILVPSAGTLPEGWRLSGVDLWPLNEQSVEGVTLHYSVDGKEILQITQQTSEVDHPPTGGISYEVVNIRGHRGYLVPDSRLTNSLTQNLFWHENGLFINLFGSLTEETVQTEAILTLAEGLN